jgi:hypothetical protein
MSPAIPAIESLSFIAFYRLIKLLKHPLMKISQYCFLLIIPVFIFAQRGIENPYLNKKGIHQFTVDSLNLAICLNLIANYQSHHSIDPYARYRDSFFLAFSPYLHIEYNQLQIRTRARVQTVRDQLIDKNRAYTGYLDFRGLQGDIAESLIQWNAHWYWFRFGRAYFPAPFQKAGDLMLSHLINPFDQIAFGLNWKWAAIESHLFFLDNMIIDQKINARYINHHRLILGNRDKSYFAISEIVLYGGQYRQPEWILLNPFTSYHAYQMNVSGGGGYNTIGMLEWRLSREKVFTEGQFLIDDIQVDKEVPGDLEPNELGLSLTAGYANGISYWINYTMIRNRTYNTTNPIEKYIYKNLPIGHWFGNNFWLLQAVAEINKEKWNSTITALYREYGDESLYSTFNTDFLNYTVEEGYDEPFPYGKIRQQIGIYSTADYHHSDYFLLNLSIAYWLKNGDEKNEFAARVGFALKL